MGGPTRLNDAASLSKRRSEKLGGWLASFSAQRRPRASLARHTVENPPLETAASMQSPGIAGVATSGAAAWSSSARAASLGQRALLGSRR